MARLNNDENENKNDDNQQLSFPNITSTYQHIAATSEFVASTNRDRADQTSQAHNLALRDPGALAGILEINGVRKIFFQSLPTCIVLCVITPNDTNSKLRI